MQQTLPISEVLVIVTSQTLFKDHDDNILTFSPQEEFDQGCLGSQQQTHLFNRLCKPGPVLLLLLV
jgi:hypothetical protein